MAENILIIGAGIAGLAAGRYAQMKLMLLGMSKTLPGLKNFYMAGQWVEPGGSVPLAAQSARNVIQLICHADGREFTTSIAADNR